MVNGCLYPSPPLQLLYTEAAKGTTKGLVRQSPRLDSYQVFKYIARCEGGSGVVPAAAQSKLSPIAVSLCSEPQPVLAVVTERVGGKQITACASPVSPPEYFPLHNTAQGQGVGICSLCIFSNSTFTSWSIAILHQATSVVLQSRTATDDRKDLLLALSHHLPLFFHLSIIQRNNIPLKAEIFSY